MESVWHNDKLSQLVGQSTMKLNVLVSIHFKRKMGSHQMLNIETWFYYFHADLGLRLGVIIRTRSGSAVALLAPKP